MRLPSRRAAGVTALFLAGSGLAVTLGTIERSLPPSPESGLRSSPAHVAVWPAHPDSGPADLASQEDSRVAQMANLASLHLARTIGAGQRPAAYVLPGAPAPTLVLTPRHAAYRIGDLEQLAPGAVVAQGDGHYLLRENLLVQAGATLRLTANRTPLTLRLQSDSRGFVTVASLGGRIDLAGSRRVPVTIESWDPAANAPDSQVADGRAYVRTIGGNLTASGGRFVSLGFAEGPTAGVVASRATSPRLAALVPAVVVRDSQFIGGANGLLVSGPSRLLVTGSDFRANLLSGMEVHQAVVGTSLAHDTADHNGLDGFTIRGSAVGISLDGDIADHNLRSGFNIDGRSVSGAVTGGASITGAEATSNAVAGVEFNDTLGAVLGSSRITDSPIGVIVSGESRDVAVTSDHLANLAQRAVDVRDGASGVTVAENQISRAATAVQVRDSNVAVSRNTIGISVYDGRLRHPVTFAGSAGGGMVSGNVFSGVGWTTVDTSRVQTGAVAIHDNDIAAWTRMQGTPQNEGPLLTWPTVARLVMILLFGLLVAGRYRPGAPRIPSQRSRGSSAGLGASVKRSASQR